MFLSDEQILTLIIEYVSDERYKQAVLIDGAWGSGKTFFIQEKLIGRVNEYIASNTENDRSVFYISLYGKENFSQIIDDIYTASLETYFDNKLGEGNGEKIGKGITFASKVITTGLKYFNVDANDLPKISDVKKLKNAIVIFDDLERCNIDTNQLLGFINNLVEHNDIKVIIVANQSEIGKPKLLSNLPQKYSVVLNPQLNLNKIQEKKSSQSQDDKSSEKIDVEQLIKYTEQIFSEDILYEKVKEKLIGLIIHYRADLDNIYETIVCKYIKVESTKSELIDRKKLVLKIFDQRQHCNIRTLIFAVMAYEKISTTLADVAFEPVKFMTGQKDKILQYVVEESIQMKSGKKLYSWTNSTAQTGTVYLENAGIWGESVFGYRFVDTYLSTRFFDSEEVKKTVLALMNQEKNIEQHRESESALSYNKLYMWWRLEDEEIIGLLDKTRQELKELKYDPRYFKDMIVTLMQLQHFEFTTIDFSDYYNTFVTFMKKRLEIGSDLNKEQLELLSDDQIFIQKYNNIVMPLFELLTTRERIEKEKINDSLNLDKSWGEIFCAGCTQNKNDYLANKKFVYYINPEKVIEKLQVSNVMDIYSFLDGIKEVYSFSNLNDFFRDDAEHLKQILNVFDVKSLSNGKITKRIALEKLKSKLEESFELINK